MQNKSDYLQAKRVTLLGAVINTLLSVFKLIVGYFGHSQALIADGVHSLSDILTDILVLFAARAHHRGPDENHPYGHGRFETLTTVLLAVLLLFIGFGIALESIEHLLRVKQFVVPSLWVLVVALISVLANEFLFQVTRRVGVRIKSDMLIANAWHSRSDALSSLVVLVGAFASYVGFHWGDALAAIFVALLILKMAVKMIWRNLRELVDTGVTEKTRQKYDTTIMAVPGVIALHQLRSRLLAGKVYLDVHVQVAPRMSVSEGHDISERVMKALYKHSDVADVTVHIDPEDDERVKKTALELPQRKQIIDCLSAANLPGFQGSDSVYLHYLNQRLIVAVGLPYKLVEQYTTDDLKAQYLAALKSLNKPIDIELFFTV